MCDAAVTSCCEKPITLPCWWSAVFSPTQPKQRWRKTLLTVKSSLKKLQPVSAAETRWPARARQHAWRLVKAFRCNRTLIKPKLRNQRAANPNVHTKEARGRKRAHPSQATQRQKKSPQKIRRDN